MPALAAVVEVAEPVEIVYSGEIGALSEAEFFAMFDSADEFGLSESEMLEGASHFAADC